MRSSFKLHQLEALVASAETGSIRAAARSLRLSQAAVTRTLRDLESSLQLPLLIRTPNGLMFTEYGNELLVHARLVLNQLAKAQSELAQLHGQAEGRLCVGVTPWILQTVLPEATLNFRRQMPGVRLELYESLMALAQPLLRDGKMDFVLGYLSPSKTALEFTCEPILNYQTAVLVRRGHARQDCRSLHDLLDQDWVMNFAPDGREAMMEHLFWRFGASIDEKHIVRVHTSALIQTFVQHAEMCTWSPVAMSLVPAFRDTVVALNLEQTFEPQQLSIISRRSSPHSSAALCFIDCLINAMRRRARSSKKEEQQLFSTLEMLI